MTLSKIIAKATIAKPFIIPNAKYWLEIACKIGTPRPFTPIMIGVKGLGVPILQAISNQYLALGMMNGLAIVALAIIFDRVTQQYGQRIQKHRGQLKK